jgi:hypothetical protein
MVVKSVSLDSAWKKVAQIFDINDTNNNGKPVMRCSRCEGFAEKDRGKGFVVLSTATTKAREHIAVYCPGILPKENIADANLRHTLLITMTEKQVSSMSKQGIALRKFDRFTCV